MPEPKPHCHRNGALRSWGLQ